MKTILWISRHEMTTEQMTDLERIMQDDIQLICYRDTVNQIETILPLREYPMDCVNLHCSVE